ncbi:MAG: aldo/keto reductase, partial [Methanobacteriota archaeon]
MQRRPLGKTGLQVSEIGFGAWAIGGNAHGNSYGPTDDGESIAAVQKAVDLGVNFFDTADVYGWGHSEEVLGKALEGRRDQVHLATKVGGDFYHGGVRANFDPGYIAFALERSLQRLRTDHVDLYQLHNPPAETVADPAAYEVLETLKAEGKIVSYGVSVHEPMEASLCLESGKPEVLQIP